MAKPKYIKISKDDLEGSVTEEALPAWEANGWTVVEDGSSEEVQQPAPQVTPKAEVKPQRPTENKE